MAVVLERHALRSACRQCALERYSERDEKSDEAGPPDHDAPILPRIITSENAAESAA